MDLRDAIDSIKSVEPIDDLDWQWKFDFREHRHAVEALKVVLFISRVA